MNDEQYNTAQFRAQVRRYYKTQGRHDLPWRKAEADGSFDAYKIMVSEVMLQQTQVSRAIPKYHSFIEQFPRLIDLAEAPLGQVLRAWNGLGYNRRAKFIHLAAQEIVTHHQGTIPSEVNQLVALPGIGINTAGAILAYAYNQPVIFIETNIRSVFLHHFFAEEALVSDREVLIQVSKTLDIQSPREWYWALMDYGTYLKQTTDNPNKRSQHYSQQSLFKGSRRQLRGQVVRLLSRQTYDKKQLQALIGDKRLISILAELADEKLIQRYGDVYSL